MNNLLNSIKAFVGYLSLMDIVLMVAVITLIALIVLMIYITRTEKLLLSNEIVEDVIVKKENVVNSDDELDLAQISCDIEAAVPKPIDLSSYEEEQEMTAIISYDELLSNTGKITLNYEEEVSNDGLLIKKVDMEKLSNDTIELPKLADVDSIHNVDKKSSTINYINDDEFMDTLSKINN